MKKTWRGFCDLVYGFSGEPVVRLDERSISRTNLPSSEFDVAASTSEEVVEKKSALQKVILSYDYS